MAKLSFGEICNKQAALVHDEWDAHFRFDLAKNVANHWIEKKLTELVLDWRDGLALEARVVARIFLRPKRTNERVFDLANDPTAPAASVGISLADF